MKYSTIIGLILLVVGLVLYIVEQPDYTKKDFYIAGFLGLGIGLFLGGIMGFLQKKRKKVVNTVISPAEPMNPVNKQQITDEETGVKF